MSKVLYIYTPIEDYSAEMAAKQLNKVPTNEPLTIRLNTPGGHVNGGWAIISNLIERTGEIIMKVDGQASSMGAIMLLFADKVISNDTSTIMFHKAAYPTWYKASADEESTLNNINSIFKDKLSAKVSGRPGAKEFLDKVFAEDVRNDVELTGAKALELGIVDEVRVLQPKAFDLKMQIVALKEEQTTPNSEGEQNNNINIKSMDLAKLKAEHPSVYAQALEEGSKNGVTAERDRVGAWMAFMDIDSEAVAKGVKEGSALTQTAMAEFTAKGIASAKISDHNEDNVDAVSGNASSKTEADLKIEAQGAEAAEALAKYNIK